MTVRCHKCNAENPDDSVSCLSCGCELAGTSLAPPRAKICGLAVAALVLGILTFFTWGITALLAVICGIIALLNISASKGLLKGKAVAVVGIVLPFVSLPAVWIPAHRHVGREVEKINCGTQLKGLSVAITVYTRDYDGNLPTPEKWCDLLIERADVSPKSFCCPAVSNGTCSYAMNRNLWTMEEKADPRLVAIFESQPGWNQTGGPELLTTEYHNGEGCSIAFANGHTEFVPADKLDSLVWTLDDSVLGK